MFKTNQEYQHMINSSTTNRYLLHTLIISLVYVQNHNIFRLLIWICMDLHLAVMHAFHSPIEVQSGGTHGE